jgi:hypothetical protein
MPVVLRAPSAGGFRLAVDYDLSWSEVNPLKLDQIRPPIVYSEMLS